VTIFRENTASPRLVLLVCLSSSAGQAPTPNLSYLQSLLGGRGPTHDGLYKPSLCHHYAESFCL